MNPHQFCIVPPKPFDISMVARSHGWFDLAPFVYSMDTRTLSFTANVNRAVSHVRVRQPAPNGNLFVTSDNKNASDVPKLVVTCLQLDEDLSEFRQRLRAEASLGWAYSSGAGRILRSPTVFEDAIKVICTTNCGWPQTKSMVFKLVQEYGASAASGQQAFPTADELAAVPESELQRVCRLGYRAKFARKLSEDVASGRIDIESLRDPSLSSDAAEHVLQSVLGFGEYSRGLMLRLTRRYAEFAVDSWCRARVSQLHPRVRDIDGYVRRRYSKWGRYAGLVFWLEITSHWHLPKADWP